MTTQKNFKRRVRERMAKTGESYTAARRQLVPDATDQAAPATPREDLVLNAEDRVVAATGHGYDHWFALLDEWGATSRTHTEIARHLTGELDVDGWWAQGIAVSYERVRGMRVPGQRAGGFEASASRTIAVPAERVFAAFEDESLRARWLPDAPLRVRTATAPRSARYDWGEDGSRVVVAVDAKGPAKATVYLTHERLPGAPEVDARKAFWRERLVTLKGLLEEA